VIDNGEPSLAECIKSLDSQSQPPDEVIVCPGPRSDLDLIESLGIKAIEPNAGIGIARVKGILAANGDIIISCDSDTIYDKHYIEYAVEDLKKAKVVKAGVIQPRNPDPLGALESSLSLLIPYEFALAFKKTDFMRSGAHLEDYSNPRRDIGYPLLKRFFPFHVDFGMECYSRLPTYGVKQFVNEHLPFLIAGITPIIAVVGITGIQGALNLLKPRYQSP